MKTGMPWQGDVRFTITPREPVEMSLHLRIPEWSLNTKVAINGVAYRGGPVTANSYLSIKRTWKPGDVVTMAFDMTPKLVAANTRVPETFGKVAVQRGPFLYCLEQNDLTGPSVFDVALTGADLHPVRRQDKFEGSLTLLEGHGLATPAPATDSPLYVYGKPALPSQPVELTLIPYFAFNNRGDTAFAVWMPLIR
jgi:DUF1680 family protein